MQARQETGQDRHGTIELLNYWNYTPSCIHRIYILLIHYHSYPYLHLLSLPSYLGKKLKTLPLLSRRIKWLPLLIPSPSLLSPPSIVRRCRWPLVHAVSSDGRRFQGPANSPNGPRPSIHPVHLPLPRKCPSLTPKPTCTVASLFSLSVCLSGQLLQLQYIVIRC